MIVAISTMKAQNVNACATPDSGRKNSFRCPSTSRSSDATPPGRSRSRSGDGCPTHTSRLSHHVR
jgi:hypothetical protein